MQRTDVRYQFKIFSKHDGSCAKSMLIIEAESS